MKKKMSARTAAIWRFDWSWSSHFQDGLMGLTRCLSSSPCRSLHRVGWESLWHNYWPPPEWMTWERSSRKLWDLWPRHTPLLMPYSFGWKWVQPTLKGRGSCCCHHRVVYLQQKQQQNPEKLASGIHRAWWEGGTGISENNQMTKQM